ncbi:MAG TPA: hypothetical protein VJN18_25630 [Polyangiaceae bacterium]|nr:hypothetical protein [Polyangiaceae bacterium]
MASRAHVHDYYGQVPERARRVARYPARSDPVIVPTDKSDSVSSILVASALIATAVILGGAYAVYAGVPPPPMAETPTPPFERAYQLDEQPLKAQVFAVLVGPAIAAPSVGAVTPEPAEQAEDLESFTPPALTSPRRTAPELAPLPAAPDASQAAPDAAPQPPPTYPNPTTTPPDAVAPPNTSPEQPVPLLDPENPYR